MFGTIGTTELVLIIVIILLLFGASRATDLFRALGTGIREFRDAASGNEDDEANEAQKDPAIGPQN